MSSYVMTRPVLFFSLSLSLLFILNSTAVAIYLCTVLYCTALHCTVLYCTALHCTELYCTKLYRTALYCTELYCTPLYRTALYCTALHCTALYCTALSALVETFYPLSDTLTSIASTFSLRIREDKSRFADL